MLLCSAYDKATIKKPIHFNSKPNLDDSGFSLPVFSSITNLKLHNTSVTTKMIKKVKTNLDSSKASGPDISVVVLKNCES